MTSSVVSAEGTEGRGTLESAPTPLSVAVSLQKLC